MPAQSEGDDLVVWFDRWRKPIRTWLRSRQNVPSGDIDDLAQEVFLRILRYSDVDLVENPQGYLFRIASNVAGEWRERIRVKAPHDDSWLAELQIDERYQPEAIAESDSIGREVNEAVNRLKPRQREILLMHVNDRLTYKQIAKIKNISYRIVMRDLTEAYAQLRQNLSNV